MPRPLVNPRLLAKQESLFQHRCAILVVESDVASDDEGNPTYEVLPDFGDVKCIVGPAQIAARDAHFDETVGSLFSIDLLTTLPGIPDECRAVASFYDEDGEPTGEEITYKVLGVQSDFVGLSTRLLCKKLV